MRVYVGLVICFFMNPLFASNNQKKEDDILGKINSRIGNPKSALEFIFSDQDISGTLLQQVGNGSPEWLKVWTPLYKVADGGQSEQLGIAMSKLLRVNAAEVLSIIKGGWKKDKDALEVVIRVCGISSEEFQDVDGLTDQQEKQYLIDAIQKRLENLSKIKSGELKSLKSACSKRLNEVLLKAKTK